MRTSERDGQDANRTITISANHSYAVRIFVQRGDAMSLQFVIEKIHAMMYVKF